MFFFVRRKENNNENQNLEKIKRYNATLIVYNYIKLTSPHVPIHVYQIMK
jgi:hypothetical protein